MPQHRTAQPTPAAHGRHRAQTRGIGRSGAAASMGVAAAALLATAVQIGSTAPAQAAPIELPGGAAPIDLPGGLPPQVQDGIDQLNNLGKSIEAQITGRPVAVRPVAGAVTSGYGSRWGAMHYGVDFAGGIGTPIHSVANGTVIEAGPASGFGLWMRVRQDDGTTAVYGHVNDLLARAGQRVNAGDVIATVGNRGNSTGPHLHLEIWDPAGRKMDPAPWLTGHGVALYNWGKS